MTLQNDLASIALDTDWIFQSGNDDTNTATAVATDAAGNTYAAGSIGGRLDGQPYEGHRHCAFLLKLDADGNEQWVRYIVAPDGLTRAFDVAVCGDRIYVSGETAGDLDGAGPRHVPYVAAYDAEGERVLLKTFERDATQAAYVAADATGFYLAVWQQSQECTLSRHDLTGATAWTQPIGIGGNLDEVKGIAARAGVVVVSATSNANVLEVGQRSLFVGRFQDNGDSCTPSLPYRFGKFNFSTLAGGVAIDAQGAIYTSCTSGPLGADQDLSGFHMIKLDAAGALVWRRTLPKGSPAGVAVDASGVTFGVKSWFDLETGEQGAGQAWAVRFSADGEPQGMHRISTDAREDAYDVALTPDGDAVLVGFTQGDLVGSHPRSSHASDIFVARIDVPSSQPSKRVVNATPNPIKVALIVRRGDDLAGERLETVSVQLEAGGEAVLPFGSPENPLLSGVRVVRQPAGAWITTTHLVMSAGGALDETLNGSDTLTFTGSGVSPDLG